MSEAELYAALHLALGATTSILFGYMSLVSGFLFMSYLVAHKLNAFLASIVIALFSIGSAMLITRMAFFRSDASAIISYMQEQKHSGNLDLSWWGTVPAWAAPVIGGLEVAVTVGGYLGCLAFFVYQRKTARCDLAE